MHQTIFHYEALKLFCLDKMPNNILCLSFLFLGIQLLTLLVPILINRLLEGPLYKEANKFCRMLHEQCLQKLMKIGPQYPQVLLAFVLKGIYVIIKHKTIILLIKN